MGDQSIVLQACPQLPRVLMSRKRERERQDEIRLVLHRVGYTPLRAAARQHFDLSFPAIIPTMASNMHNV